jgi:hypothetical protein
MRYQPTKASLAALRGFMIDSRPVSAQEPHNQSLRFPFQCGALPQVVLRGREEPSCKSPECIAHDLALRNITLQPPIPAVSPPILLHHVAQLPEIAKSIATPSGAWRGASGAGADS